jgi:hypothetical protein
MRWVQQWVREKETGNESSSGDDCNWEPTLSAVGLQKVSSADGSMWVSEECAEEYSARGKAALAS